MKLDENALYLTMFPSPFGKYRYIRLPFRADLAGDIFQKKIDELFSRMPNIFGIADDILITDHDEQNKNYDDTLKKVPHVCRQVNVSFTKIIVSLYVPEFLSLAK